jgi:TolB-like protein/DNA-binding SARP family transcriptional activator
MLRLSTFAGCVLERDGVRVDTASAQRKGLALLAVLAAAGERGVERDALLALLWPESDEERARTSLRQLVHVLRNQLETPELLTRSAELRLNAEVISSDVAEFRAAIAAGDLETAAGLYRGPFLDAFHIRGADELERWIATERVTLASAAARAIETLAQRAEGDGDLRAAIGWWRRLGELEPLSGHAAIGLMRCLDAAGERAAALRHARVHELLVQGELGEAPDGVVAAFAEKLRSSPPQITPLPPAASAAEPNAAGTAEPGQPPAASFVVPTPMPARPRFIGGSLRRTALAAFGVLVLVSIAYAVSVRSRAEVQTSIAVLPLANTSGDPTDDVISDGLTENLIASLATIPDARVIGRTSAFRFRERALDIRAIADSLGVTTILDGSVQRAGEQLKVSVQLVRAADGTVIWAETYDRRMIDLFVVQDEITRSIVNALHLRLGRTPPAPPPLRDVEAYELYLRGRHLFTSRTDREGTEHARQYFEAALARDSLLAAAHAGLSDVYGRFAIFAHIPAREGHERARMHALRALALDSTLAEAHAALAHMHCVTDFEWDAAERGFERALALNPGYLFARMPFAICLMSTGRFRDAERALLAAQRLDPLSPAPSNMLGRLYVYQQQPDRAIAHLMQALELSPQMDLAWQQLGHAYLQKRMHGEAIRAFQRAAALSGARDSAHLAYAYAVTGDTDMARGIIADLEARPEGSAQIHFHLALAHAGLGDADRAFHWLHRGFDEQASFMNGVFIDPAFAPLRSDPRWPALVSRLRLSRSVTDHASPGADSARP